MTAPSETTQMKICNPGDEIGRLLREKTLHKVQNMTRPIARISQTGTGTQPLQATLGRSLLLTGQGYCRGMWTSTTGGRSTWSRIWGQCQGWSQLTFKKNMSLLLDQLPSFPSFSRRQNDNLKMSLQSPRPKAGLSGISWARQNKFLIF